MLLNFSSTQGNGNATVRCATHQNAMIQMKKATQQRCRDTRALLDFCRIVIGTFLLETATQGWDWGYCCGKQLVGVY